MTAIGDCTKTIQTAEGEMTIYSLRELEKKGIIRDLSKMPYSIKIIVEGLLRQDDGKLINDDDVKAIASWNPEEIGRASCRERV